MTHGHRTLKKILAADFLKRFFYVSKSEDSGVFLNGFRILD